MKLFFRTLPRNILGCFKGRMLFWHLTAIILTIALIVSGLDWQYFLWAHSRTFRWWFYPAIPMGTLLPMVLPLTLFVLSRGNRSAATRRTAWAISQAVVIALVIAAGYKAITGRPRPPLEVGTDLERLFRFGLLRGGVYWGWPSSHTTVAFAMAVTVFRLFPTPRWLRYVAMTYGFLVGFGVSMMTIHWLSDAVAGALMGTVVGMVVGTSFSRSQQDQGKSC